MIQKGDRVADFTLQTHTGDELSWSDLAGRPVVFFFYPKASTPGCTKEAVGFTTHREAFEALGVQVVGVSADTVKRQANFVTKHELSMPLLADTERALIEPWGIWQEKKNYGRTYMGIVRTTVLVDADGVVAEVWSPVKVAGHVEAVLERARALTGGADAAR